MDICEKSYLDLWVACSAEGEEMAYGLGTFKTLDSSGEAMHIMAGLLADFIIEGTDCVNRNQDDFIWEGADVRALDENGAFLSWCYSCSGMEDELKRKEGLLEKYPKVVIRDNATRKEVYFILHAD